MTKSIQDWIKFKPLLMELVMRDIKIKYRRSILGVFWTLLNPLLMMLVLSVVFSSLFKFDIENFPLYILSGQVIFNFFSESTSISMSAVITSAPLIKKVYIPKYLLVFSKIFSSIINLFAAFTALLLVMVVTRAPLHWNVVLFFIPLVFLILFSTGVGLILAAITVEFRDIMHLYSVFITVLMYLTPVIYPMSIFDGSNFAWVGKIVELNPITNILSMFREIMFHGMLPGIGGVIIALVEALGVFALGMYIFYKKQDEFILYI